MIEKIRRIRSFGSYVNFDWPAALCEFKRFNLFYGWNYSGKTMLSRILRCFENKALHPDFPSAQAQIDCAGGTSYQLTAPDTPLEIRVFNSDFVRDNIKFEAGSAAPVLILGAADIAKQEVLGATRHDHEKISRSKETAETELGRIETALEKAMTAKARDAIKNPLSVPNYDKTIFVSKVLDCLTAPETHQLDDESISKYTAQYLSKEKKYPLKRITLAITSFDGIRDTAASILTKSVTGKRIPRLGADPTAERWVDSGRPLHENKEVCLFCGQPLPPDLMDSLKEHFSAEYDRLMSDISDLLRAIGGAEKEGVSLPHPTEFYPELAAEFFSERSRVERLVQERLSSLGKLAEAVDAKRSKAFATLACPEIEDPKTEIVEHVAEINRLIDLHNQRSSDFERTRDTAFSKLEMNAAATFIVEQDYATRGIAMEGLRSEIESAKGRLAILENDILTFESETSEATRGAEQINDLLKAYFGKQGIKIAVSDAGQFQILRGGSIAKNLSEGEETAIAFAYYITRVQDGKHPLAETIVVIDDPISSLDANHLFNTYSLIKNEIGECRQLFLLTHSFELFNLVKEWAADAERKKLHEYEKWKSWCAFLVAKTDNGASEIKKIPPELMRFKSEYHYLFGELYRFASEPTGNFDRLFSLPNVVRRFMEAFGGIMIPTYEGLHSKAERIFQEKVERERVLKFINHYSHQTTVMRSLTIPDASECKSVVDSCLNAVKKWDNEYFEDLKSEIS